MYLRVLELYSGIGGFHYALEEAQIQAEVVAAADINNVANAIYRHNFKNTNILQRCIESLSVRELDELSPDLIHLSPPCQPFVRVGKQQDKEDIRSKSFLHLLTIIPQMKKQPCYIFLENVKGFDNSETRDVLLEMLTRSGYSYQEFLLSPLQCGIPNSRLRYYLMAKLKPLTFAFQMHSEILLELPACAEQFLRNKQTTSEESPVTTEADIEQDTVTKNSGTQLTAAPTEPKSNQTIHSQYNSCTNAMDPASCTYSATCRSDKQPEGMKSAESKEIADERSQPLYERCQHLCCPLSDFLEKQDRTDSEYLEQFMVPEKFLKRFWVMDIVKLHHRKSCCFTKRYGHHIEGAGSVIQTADVPVMDLTQYQLDRVYTEAIERGVRSLRLRFFTPREIANLMCFPQDFNFPPEVSTIQCYRVLGNSLNVHVVAVLLKLMLMDSNIEKASC